MAAYQRVTVEAVFRSPGRPDDIAKYVEDMVVLDGQTLEAAASRVYGTRLRESYEGTVTVDDPSDPMGFKMLFRAS